MALLNSTLPSVDGAGPCPRVQTDAVESGSGGIETAATLLRTRNFRVLTYAAFPDDTSPNTTLHVFIFWPRDQARSYTFFDVEITTAKGDWQCRAYRLDSFMVVD